MNSKITLVCFFLFFGSTIKSQAQNLEKENPDTHFHNTSANPCISEEEYQLLQAECFTNIKNLGLDKVARKSTAATLLNWPLRGGNGLKEKDYHFIGAYVDHNKTVGAIKDYNCESNTYDGHQGTDIAIWPFGLYKMDNNHVEVIAAAAGTIVQKADGNFDKNCGKNALTANSIIIQHADGTYALYWHMKKNSVTTKKVGDAVIAGEYLGVVGSSGSSSGPHLHFEIRKTLAQTDYQDPFAGSCNLINANSLWVKQPEHTNPAVLKVSVNTTDIVAPGCPTTEISNESDLFSIPFQGNGLPAGYAKFYVFFREIPLASIIDLKILNPDNTVFSSWAYNATTFYKNAYFGWSKKLPATNGIYTFQAIYNGKKTEHKFEITSTTLGVSELVNTSANFLDVYPNPASQIITVKGDDLSNGYCKIAIKNISGQEVISTETTATEGYIQKEISVAELSNGIYFVSIENINGRIIKKVIIQH